MVNIQIDEHSGFCFGVVYAIQMAEDELEEHGKLYCLGDIVHNDIEVKRLTDKGLKIINHDDLKNLHNCKVLIRAHGEPPSTYLTALENNIELIDASCPVVLKLQYRVKTAFDSGKKEKAQMVIYGIPGHAEVNGLIGQTNGEAIIVRGEEDLEQIDFARPIFLYSQTTKSTDKFYHLKSIIEQRATSLGNSRVISNDTICRQVSNRDIQLRDFAKRFDVVIFVSGKKSSNGKVLFNVCLEQNPNTHFVSDTDEIQEDWFAGAKSVGICGATSTPLWLMEKISAHIQSQTASAIA